LSVAYTTLNKLFAVFLYIIGMATGVTRIQKLRKEGEPIRWQTGYRPRLRP